jgi:alpha-1,6-mannosyltransferase
VAQGEGGEVGERRTEAVSSRNPMSLYAPGVVIAAAFALIAWLGPPTGAPLFMAALGAAIGGYLWALARVAANPHLSRRLLMICAIAALAWRVPLVFLPELPARDAMRYIWDARVHRAGLDPYQARPDDPALDSLHSPVTRGVDASWLPTIYPPVAQLYFRAVAAVDESITAFRLAALVCDGAIMVVLVRILRATRRPTGWMLAYAWHPLVPLEGALGAHLDFVGVLALLLSLLALIRGRTAAAALAFFAAVLVKPLPLVLAPLFWRRVRLHDVLVALTLAGALTYWAARGHLPFGSLATFVDEFRFNGPLFNLLAHFVSPRAIAGVAVLIALIAAGYLRRTTADMSIESWIWPLTLALLLAPVIYPWYLVWLIPFSVARMSATPAWIWSVSVLAIYPTWFLRGAGDEWSVPASLLVVEFLPPAIAAMLLVLRVGPFSLRRIAHEHA